MAETEDTGGQPAEGTQFETTETGPEGSVGESVATQTTESGPEELTFFDPESIRGKPELETAYKQMQGAFSKKTQEIAKQRRKIEAYDSFKSDPIGTIQALARQYGYSVMQGQPEQSQQEFEPQTWDDVLKAAEERAEQRLMKKFAPLVGKVENLQQKNIETYLDTNHPDWRTYEDQMTKLVREHPTLAKDPDTLYDLAIPRNIREARATKAALAKIQAGTGASQISGGSQTSKQVSDMPKKGMTFQEAYEFAKRKIKA